MVLTGWCLYLRQKGPERIMISMPQVQSIRRLRRNGESVASIARKTHVSEPTVRKYLAKEDLSAVPSVRKPRASVIDPYLPVIEGLRVKMCVWLGVSRGLDLAFLNAD